MAMRSFQVYRHFFRTWANRTRPAKKEIAYQLTISDKTVKNILTRVFVKTGTRSRTELAV
ncbi:MAG: response regulator transcription factor [Chloroflexi bacterium]|nr:response regulator transcription factor [Chloroflexota bacterium]